jgi:hypothetical protein
MNTIEFPKPAKLWTGDEISDDTWTKATANYTNKLLPLLRKHNVTIEKVDPEFPTQYFQCQHRSRHFQLPINLNIKHIEQGIPFLNKIHGEAQKIIESGCRDIFHYDIDHHAKLVTKGEGRFLTYSILCDFVREAGIGIHGD